MSVVAVKVTKNKITIGADSILVSGWTQEKDKLAKLNKVKEFLIGDVGDAQEGSLFWLFCKTNTPKDSSVDSFTEFMWLFQSWLSDKTGKETIENEYIIVYDKKVFLIEGFYIREVTDYASIGAGRDFAITTLKLGHSVKEAIKMACELSIYCEEPINIIEVEK